MKLTKIEGSENYTCQVVRLPIKQSVTGLDKLVKVTVFGNDILTQKDSDENQLYLFFPAECQIHADYLSKNNEFRETSLNYDKGAKAGFFEPSGRVKAIKFKGVISTGYLAPLSTLECMCQIKSFKEGDEFNSINGYELCKKYIVKHIHNSTPNTESRYNRKLNKFDKLVPNQFRFHDSTLHLAKNLHLFNLEDIIVITDKWHGTSAVFSNVLIKKELSLLERFLKWTGVDIVTTRYDRLYSSRSVIKNQYINKEATPGYYNEDIWAIVNKELEDKIDIGITLYGEIVGYLQSGKMIQKGYDYDCNPGQSPSEPLILVKPIPEHRFIIYRITYTKPNGEVIEFSWQQIKEYCKKYSIEHVKEIYFGRLSDFWENFTSDLFSANEWFNVLSVEYLEKNCKWNKNIVPSEGICVRIDGKEKYSTFKLKSKRFLEYETKEIDKGEVNIEDDATINNN